VTTPSLPGPGDGPALAGPLIAGLIAKELIGIILEIAGISSTMAAVIALIAKG
jgi:hypothetical protein